MEDMSIQTDGMTLEVVGLPKTVEGVSSSDFNLWGCPHCGYRGAGFNIQGGGVALGSCGECGKRVTVLADGLERSERMQPEVILVKHPREGTPKHGRPDKKPEEGGEYFSPRGIGMDRVDHCFVCGREMKGYGSNIAAFVQCRDAGLRVVELFKGWAWLDYREREPDYVQVKLGTCEQHLPYLKELRARTSVLGRIDENILASVVAGEKAVLKYTVTYRERDRKTKDCLPEVHTLWETPDEKLVGAILKFFDYDKAYPDVVTTIDHLEVKGLT
jgi:hypothetical protein